MITLDYLYKLREFFGPLLAPNLGWLQLAAVIFSGLFIWGIIHIIAKTGYFRIKAEELINLLGQVGTLPKMRSLKAWKQIQKKLSSEDPRQWKTAILEADRILNEILKMAGYLGKMETKFDIITPAQLTNVEDVKIAHNICHQIIQDPDFEPSREAALQTIEIYRKSFVELNLIQE